jgi:predicted hotdog family 3-hydroxylacyl-ACP dehydratase
VTGAALDRSWLITHLPHQGRMNLLDEIVAWDATTLRALARNHRAGDHPLRRAGVLPITCGIEYGAQAAAAHGALARATKSPPGFIASVRSVVFHAARLDDVDGALDVVVEQIGASEAGVTYRFEVSSRTRSLVEGRLTVAFAR